jgi:hypothetical protein
MLRTIPRAAVGGSLTLVRLPIDGALQLAGGNDSIELALDRAEAAVRSLAGMALADEVLIDDAARRREAADERARAQRLRAAAERHTERAEERVAHGVNDADRVRARAAEEEQRERQEARERSKSQKARAEKTAKRRKSAAADLADRREEAIDDAAKRERLHDLETREGALQKKGEALTAREEAARLEEAASRVKAQRKAKRG